MSSVFHQQLKLTSPFTIAIDPGSFFIKASLNNETFLCDRSVACRYRPTQMYPDPKYFCGEEGLYKRGIFRVFEPIVSGNITPDNYEHFEAVLDHTIHNLLRQRQVNMTGANFVSPITKDEALDLMQGSNLLFALQPSMSDEAMIKLAEISLEHLQVGQLCMAPNPLLTLLAPSQFVSSKVALPLKEQQYNTKAMEEYTRQKQQLHDNLLNNSNLFYEQSGIVIDSGFGSTSVASIRGGIIHYYDTSSTMGGKAIVDNLKSNLAQLGYDFSTRAEREILFDMMIKHGVCATESELAQFRDEIENNKAQNTDNNIMYELPDGQVLPLSFSTRYSPIEPLFSSTSGNTTIIDACYKCLNSSDYDANSSSILLSNIVLNGGVSKTPNFETRIFEGLSHLLPPHMPLSSTTTRNIANIRLIRNYHEDSQLANVKSLCALFQSNSTSTSRINGSLPSITKQQCEEYGMSNCVKQMFNSYFSNTIMVRYSNIEKSVTTKSSTISSGSDNAHDDDNHTSRMLHTKWIISRACTPGMSVLLDNMYKTMKFKDCIVQFK